MENRQKILEILSHIEQELCEIRKLMDTRETEVAVAENFNWSKALNDNFNVDQKGLPDNFRLEVENVKRANHRMKNSEPAKNGEPINLVLDLLNKEGNHNQSMLKILAVQTILMELCGFTFGPLPEDISESQYKWFNNFMELRDAYQGRVLTYNATDDFDWNKCFNLHFSLNQINITAGYGLKMAEAKRTITCYLEKRELPKNGLPLNIIIRFFRGNCTNSPRQKICAIITLLMEKNGYNFGKLPDGVSDVQKKWFQEINKMRDIYRDRITIY